MVGGMAAQTSAIEPLLVVGMPFDALASLNIFVGHVEGQG